ncbi:MULTISPECIES: bifunctional polysaccharide deacetylase/glycosyltransferase family 2 protein [unclassified Streptomyces]|uniref:bifunctional polysaccharide deacetylase/glycosyltransferase family 2 protein n=1 Tax=unclassified Streptomyces TaxID=2593676 RepID=UPI002ED05123|nr:bifunctional polysaccharide deacetylase/glycosyltransferase family 2 protein [Streptomyces sp. NBC_00891]WSY08815.1 bifunctional polysaccharide deacetylase/glycosyltransferase family 2 protein [Streptomyces sp. NBC_00890]WSZ10438.1 bifunctional polysaccharide deacetylase/glycosyltransferase family 2 protein [Streptomyces sp. NBC_00869]WSZ22059.1 bifunctional polysaccharide deacetylase/glycosyltransferase family 2 protein [Streptomyces sp. NBC_00870]
MRRGRRTRRQTVPGPRVVIALLLLLGLVSVMLLDGYLRAEVGNDQRVRSDASASKVPEDVLDGGPLLSFRGGTAHTQSVPDKTIVLTFDDGPDPEWTREVLGILDDNDVPGTFFLVGSMIARYPDVVREMVDDGNEVGVHTFTHVDLSYQSTARVTREIAQTQLALAGAAGITTTLFRAPYSSTNDAIDNYSWSVYKKLGALGYTSVFIDTDSEDWQQPGVPAIVANATPESGKGASVLFHDAGGDRAQTLEALPRYIKKMKAAGYTFTTVSGAQQQADQAQGASAGDGAPPAAAPTAGSAPEQAAHRRAGTTTLWEGRALLAAVAVAEWTVPGLAAALTVVGVAVLGRFGMMLLLARRHHRRRNRRRFVWGPAVTEPVSVIVPAYNEKECIAHTLASLASSTHPIEIIVVDDGSTDGTAEIAESLGLPNVRVVRQENAGKSAALNNGVRHARHDLVVMMDGDTVFEPDTVRRLVQPFGDPEVGAVAGNAKVGNRDTVIGAWQHIEYVMGFNLDRRMYDLLRCMPTIPGAIGAFRRRAVLAVGGMSEDTLAEDTDITIALHRAGWRVVYAEHARAWTEAPASLGQLWRQRYRWSYGTMQALWKHRRSVTDRGPSGRFGRVGMPLVVLFQIVTPLFAPLIDVFTLYAMLFVDLKASVLAWLAVLLVQLVCAAYAFRLDREKYRYLLMLPLQQLAYRQLMYLVLIHSCVTAATGGRLRWQKLKRTGTVGTPASGPGAR